VTQHADKLNDIGRNLLLGNRKKIAKFLMRTFTCRSTFLYGCNVQNRKLEAETKLKNGECRHVELEVTKGLIS
jgi:hypothetical protein